MNQHPALRTVVKKSPMPPDLATQPKFELVRTGPDVTENEGVAWIYLECPSCNSYSRFVPLKSVIVESEDEYGATVKDHHTLCQCERCEDVIYVKFWEIDFDPDWTFQYEMHSPSLPMRGMDAAQILDLGIAKALKEAQVCINAGAYLAAVVMLRRCVEGVLREHGQRNGEPLGKAIERLTGQGVLHASMLQVADIVRLVGNSGAHDLSADISKEQAREAYELTVHLLHMLYAVPRKHLEYKKRLQTQTKQTADAKDRLTSSGEAQRQPE